MESSHTFVAIDLGASNGRIVLGRLVGHKLTLSEAHRFAHGPVSSGNRLHWDWARIIDEVRHGLRTACEMTKGDTVAGVSCDAWAQDFGLLDDGGKLLFPPVSYRDQRTAGLPGRFSDVISPLELRRRVGSVIAPMTTLCQLRAMVEQEPDTLGRARTLLHIADLVHYDLCGKRGTDWTNATASQLRHLAQAQWDTDLLDRLGISSSFLPRIFEGPTVLGNVVGGRAPHPKLDGVPVIIGANHDTSAATAAIAPMGKGALFLSLGTWAMLGCCTDELFLPDDLSDESIAVLGLAFGKWALFGSGTGLWILQECRRIWETQGIRLSYDEISRVAAESSISSTLDANDPRFFSPTDMVAEICAACREGGQAIPESTGDIARVVFLSLAASIHDEVQRLSDVMGTQFTQLRIVSGGSKDAFLCGQIAQAIGIPVVAGPAEATTIGNILLQAWALGIVESTDTLQEIMDTSFPVVRYPREQ